MNARYVLGIVITIAIVASVAFLGSQPTGLVPLASEGKIRIGSIQPLTGSAASIGQSARAAIELAVEEINANGGINGKQLEIVMEDGQCDAKAASTAAKKLVEVDNVLAILGGTCSSETMAAAPVAEANKTVMLSNCSSNPAITDSGDYVFRVYPSDSFQGKVGAEYAFNELGARKVAILSCQSDWCAGLKGVFKQHFQEIGGSIVAEEEFAQGTNDLKTELLKIKEASPDLLYFPSYESEAAVGIKQARELGLQAGFMGGDAWGTQVIWDAAGNAGEGAIFTSTAVALTEEFRQAMKEKLGGNEITDCAPQAYDAVYVLAGVLRKCGEDSECIKRELYKVQGFQGVSGTIGFDENGDLATGDYTIMKVENRKPVKIGG